LEVLDIVFHDLLSVIPELVVHPLSDELERRLGTECILSWHIKIIDEANTLLPGFKWLILILSLSLEVALNYILDTLRRGTSGKVDYKLACITIKS